MSVQIQPIDIYLRRVAKDLKYRAAQGFPASEYPWGATR
jgi:hypothetical protein